MDGAVRSPSFDRIEVGDLDRLTPATGAFVGVFFFTRSARRSAARSRNANRLVRYYSPKRSSFDRATQQDLDRIASLLNERPRKSRLLTPNECTSTKPLFARPYDSEQPETSSETFVGLSCGRRERSFNALGL